MFTACIANTCVDLVFSSMAGSKMVMTRGMKLLSALFFTRPIRIKGQECWNVVEYVYRAYALGDIPTQEKTQGLSIFGHFYWYDEVNQMVLDSINTHPEYSDIEYVRILMETARIIIGDIDGLFFEEGYEDDGWKRTRDGQEGKPRARVSQDDVSNFFKHLKQYKIREDPDIKRNMSAVVAVKDASVWNWDGELPEERELSADYGDIEDIKLAELEAENWKRRLPQYLHEYVHADFLMKVKFFLKDSLGNSFNPY